VARVVDDKVASVQVRNVPSFVIGLDVPINVHGLGTVAADVAFGGQLYVHAPAANLGVELAVGECALDCQGSDELALPRRTQSAHAVHGMRAMYSVNSHAAWDTDQLAITALDCSDMCHIVFH
jgi:proline racemase